MHERLEWDDVRFFLAAARAGGFGAAARTLQAQQSTVSRRVASLEARLGAALFDRTPGGLELTQLGRRILEDAGAMEAALRRVRDAASTTGRAVAGQVRIALTETMASAFVLPVVLPALLARHPDLRVDLVTGNTAADLSRREADVAIRFFLTPRGDLLTKRVARLETAVLAHPQLARRLARTPLREWPFVATWLPAGRAPEEAWRDQHAGGVPRVTTNSFHTQLEAVRSGVGVAVLPRALREPAGLVELPLDAPRPPPVAVYLVTPRALRRVPRVAAVFEALEDALRRLG